MLSSNYRQHIPVRMFSTLSLVASLLCIATPSGADSRTEALNAIAQLQQSATHKSKPDDMGSIESTFLTAEQYMHEHNRELAERYYLLTLQKTRILKASLAESNNEHPQLPAPPEIAPLPPNSEPSADNALPLQSPEQETNQNTSTSTQVKEPVQTPVANSSKSPGIPEYESVTSDKLVGSVDTYIVVKNDTLRLISAKLGVSRQHLLAMNRLDPKALLRVGQKLNYNNRKIVPQRMTNGIVINIPDRTLYYFSKGKLETSLPVALGVPKKNDKYDWTTPTGKFKIIAKQKDPTWFVPQSIQSEMEEDGKDVITSIPPGPTNPLGKYAMKTSMPGILIHSTTKPWSIYSFASHGCIRVYPDHMEEFFKKIRVNTPGEIIYRPVKIAITENGRVFLEVHQDTYGKSSGLQAMAKQLIEKHNLSKRVDWNKVESVVKHKAGLAEDVTL